MPQSFSTYAALLFGIELDLFQATLLLVIFAMLCIILAQFKSRRNLEIKQNLILSEFPLHFCICDKSGKVIMAQTERVPNANFNNLKRVQDLPADPETLNEIITAIKETFKTNKVVVRDISSSNRQAFLKKLDEKIFGKECVLWVSMDITKQAQLRKQLEEAIAEHKSLVNFFKTAVFILDQDGNVSFANKQASNLVGYPIKNMQGVNYKKILNIINTDTEISALDVIAKVYSTATSFDYAEKFDIIPRNTSRIPIGLAVHPLLDSASKIKCVMVSIDDISSAKAERESMKDSHKILTYCTELGQATFFRYFPIERKIVGAENIQGFWPYKNGEFLPESEWVYKEDIKKLIDKRDMLIKGEIKEFSIVYRTDYYGKMRYYKVSAIRELNQSNQPNVFGILQDVTEVNAQAIKNDQNQQFIDILLKRLPSPFLMKEISDDYRYIMCSKSWYDLFGLTPKDVIGKNVFEVFPQEMSTAAYEKDKLANNPSGYYVDKEKFFNKKLKEYRYYHTIKITYNTLDGKRMMFAMFVDITDAELSAQRQIELKQFYQYILNSLPASVVAKDADDDLKYILWNTTTESHTGCPANKILGKTDYEIEPYKGMQDNFRKLDLEIINNGKEQRFNESLTTATGKTFEYSTIKKLIKMGSKSYLIKLAMDMTRERQLERESQRYIQLLNDNMTRSNMINTCLKRITVENDFGKSLNDMLLILGSALDADRAYAFNISSDRSSYTCENEWIRDGVFANKKRIYSIDAKEIEPWKSIFDATGCIKINDINELAPQEPLAKRLRQQEIKSLLCIGITRNNEHIGFLGLDFIRKQKEFTDGDIRTLQGVASLLLIAYQRKEQFDLVAESGKIQKLIIDMIHIPVMLIDKNYKVIHANKAAAMAMGVSYPSCIGKTCYGNFCKLMSPDSTCIAYNAIESRKLVSKEQSILGKDYQISAMPIKRNGEVIQVLETFIDLTEINRSKILLKEAAENAEQAAKAKSLFLATMSHELRTPLNAVIGFAELLKIGDMSKQDTTESINSIYIAANTLLNLINDVLDLSKLEAGQMSIIAQKTDFSKLLYDIRAIFDHKLKEKNLHGRTKIKGNLPLLYIDNLRMRQILLNILGNAVKFTNQGGIDIWVEFIPDNDKTGSLKILIKDTGIGISKEDISKVFEPFAQVESKENRVHKGTGLGLPICKRLVEQMHGTIVLNSVVGKGSSFTITIPNIKYEEGALPTLESSFEIEKCGNKMKIILVDDVEMNLKVLGAMLSKFGVELKTVTSPEAALETLKTFKADALFTDLWMPHITGIELAQELRKTYTHEQLKLVLVTADTEIEKDLELKNFDGMLLKPITLEKIKKLLSNFNSKNEALGGGGYS